MVEFLRLRLTGFKSFVDATELPIESGLTGIVGPNGCGKSNLVEALRWVMGETSAKRLRGSEMDDVIFGGNSERPARNIAEVVLHLSNADRKAPSQFNDSDELEIIRRIERASGSLYKVNGREARARDVQLLFADAASGAHSAALVSQGRVGALINAKPSDRRHLLEEAAGISGLYSRRHEAELRLKAAETNLARLEDVIVTLESQLQTLKKQARQAARYRTLSEQLRKLEAAILYLQWQDWQHRDQETKAALQAAERLVAAYTEEAASAATRQAECAATLPDLRKGEAEAAAALQRLTLARQSLEQEEARLAEQIAGLERRLQQIAHDRAREEGLLKDAEAALARLSAEEGGLRTGMAQEQAALEAAAAAIAGQQAEVETLDRQLGETMRRLAEEEAALGALNRSIHDLEARQRQLAARQQEAEIERARLMAEMEEDGELAEAARALSDAEVNWQAQQLVLAEAESRREEAAKDETLKRQQAQDTEGPYTRLTTEAETLLALLGDHDSDLWPPLVDALVVSPGLEVALGAALGDDLSASTDQAAPVYWQVLEPYAEAPSLPAGAEPLSHFVQGSPALVRRLSQIGLVGDAEAGRRLSAMLIQGQRLVTRDGALWRWDGFIMAAGATTAAASRLQQRNRLQELRPQLAAAETVRQHAQDAFRMAESRTQEANRAWQQQRSIVQDALSVLDRARKAHAVAAERSLAGEKRLAALLDRLAGLQHDRQETETALLSARSEIDRFSSIDPLRDALKALQIELATGRSRLAESRSQHDRLKREMELRARRLSDIANERLAWQHRHDGAMQQIANLGAREEESKAEKQALADQPAVIARQREELHERISEANQQRNRAGDQLAVAEQALQEADRELKQAERRLQEAREDFVRKEAALAQVQDNIQQFHERVREKLACMPAEAAGVAELDPAGPLPDREGSEAKLQRLLRERDGMGPVNLRAEAEAAELDQQINGLQTERNDLLAAIARLRQGIASLNREGRERLLAAFSLVNGHFEELFTRLFGGGRAHLALTEAEDPLEAGLEIMASPPGKKLQVMSLLSGGEQALTALALIFAVFLTNPAPVCVLDEVDAPLDDANVDRFCTLVQDLTVTTGTRFLIITHHRLTMARMDRLFGVTMVERGVSQLVSVDLQRAAALRQSA